LIVADGHIINHDIYSKFKCRCALSFTLRFLVKNMKNIFRYVSFLVTVAADC